MSTIITPRTLSGFMELEPQEQVLFEHIKNVLESTYKSFGFFPIDTPVLEYSEILLAKAGGETEKQIYRFNKGDTDLTMRFDLTVPLAKYVAKNQGEISFPFRRYQIGKVYRGERAQKGRFREFYQADIDIIGDGELSIINDAEMPSIIYNVFNKLGIEDFTFRINNRKILYGLFEMYDYSDKVTDILRVIDKFDKIGLENVLKELEEIGVGGDAVADIVSLLTMQGTDEEKLAALKAHVGKNELFDTGVEELTQVLYYIGKFGVPAKNYKIDLTIARGLDYYTGTVYETTINKHPEIGSVCSGGRYDNLAAYYTKKQLPGVGMSIGLTRLFYILNEYKYINEKLKSPIDVLLIPMTDDMSKAVETAAVIRSSGINIQTYLEDKKFKQKLAYANKLSIPYCIFIGESEIESNLLTVKDMNTGEQQSLTVEECISTIKNGIDEINSEKCVIIPE